jgi:hypothetical protein
VFLHWLNLDAIKQQMGFFKKIFNHSKPPMPLGTLAWVNELNGLDEIATIEFATQQLHADAKNNLFQDNLYLDALFSVDEKIRIIVEKTTAHYVNIDNINIELEERMAGAAFLYHRQLFLIYVALVENLASTQPTSLLMMLARAINSATEMIKWRYYNYLSAPMNVWLQISKLYLIGEKHALLESNIQTYPNQEITTLSSIYMHACMLGSLESLSFKRQQIDFVSRMLTNWASEILVQNTFDEKNHLFYVNTTSDMPARRIRNFNPDENYRYWCFDSINSKIELCLISIESNGSSKQQWMNEFINNKYALETLRILRAEWSRIAYKRQRREHERTKTAKTATATFSFESTCYHIKQYENIQVQRGDKYHPGDKTLEEKLASHHIAKDGAEPNIIYFDLGADQSSIVDESSQGLGLHISKQIREVSLGMMVGVSLQGQKDNTKIGVIRSIKPIIGNELHIGVEVLSNTGFCVKAKNISRIVFKPVTSDSVNGFANTVFSDRKNFSDPISFDNQAISFTCLHLPKEFSICKQDTLIVPRLHYNKNDVYKVNLLGKEVPVKFSETLEHHENWLQVTYTEEV